MHKEDFAGKWHQLKGKVQEKWNKLTHDDLAHINGKYELLVDKLQKRYGYTKDQAELELRNWEGCCEKSGHSGRSENNSKHHQLPKNTCSEKHDSCKSHDKKDNHRHDRKEKDRKAS